MKLNQAEKTMLGNPVRTFILSRIIAWMRVGRPLDPGMDILELGCGRGAGVRLLQKYFQPRRLAGLDLDHDQIKTAVSYLGRPGRQASLCVGAAETLPFADHAFDAVFSFGVLHHLPDWRSGLGEVARVLKPGGYYFLEDYYPGSYANAVSRHVLKHPRHDRFVGPDLRDALEKVGAPLIRAREVRGFGIIGVCRKK
ncbi:MAG: class I SAM-dependent methyltransferase [Pseudomonadota bacterium]